METIVQSYQYVIEVLTDVYFHRHLAATFFGVVAGFLLSLTLQRRHERKSSRHTRDMYLLALQVELTHNGELLQELAEVTAGPGKKSDYYRLEFLRSFYSLLEGLIGRLRFSVFDGLMANGMLGFLEDQLVQSILETNRRIDRLVLEIKSSQAWLPQAPGESDELWLARKKGILDHLETLAWSAFEQTLRTRGDITELLPEKLTDNLSPSLTADRPHQEIGVD